MLFRKIKQSNKTSTHCSILLFETTARHTKTNKFVLLSEMRGFYGVETVTENIDETMDSKAKRTLAKYVFQ